MSDDIDIEEHNLLENPVLKKIFPDISAIKQEILFPFDYNLQYGAKPEVKTNEKSTKEYNFTSNASSFKYVIKIEDSEEQEEDIEEQEEDIDRMIIDEGVAEVDETNNDVNLPLESSGSRNQISEESYIQKLERYTLENMQTQIMHVNIVLENVNPYLQRSNRFCDICLILFPETGDLTKHNYSYHCGIAKSAITDTKAVHVNKQVRNKRYEFSNYFPCDKCATVCKNTYILNLHKKKHDKIKKLPNTIRVTKLKKFSLNLPCDRCEKVCQNHHNLKMHKQWHEKIMALEKKSLKKHIESKRFVCQNCGITCKNSYILERHIVKMHSTYSKNNKNNDKLEREKIKNTRSPIVNSNEPDNSNQDISYKNIGTGPTLTNSTNTVNDANFFVKGKQTEHEESTLNVKPAAENLIDSVICCYHCSSKFQNQETYIDHLYNIIQNKTVNEDKNLLKKYSEKNKNVKKESKGGEIFKSVLYKCRKCDIHFLYAKAAMNHVQHMDLLINWKCSTCMRIFKNEDKYLHLQQHVDNNDIKVYDLCETEFLRVLYKCPKCAVHFSEDSFISHYSICGHETNQSKYCKVCDILVEQNAMQDHEKQHINNNLRAHDFIFVVTEMLNSEKTTFVSKSNRLQEIKIYYCDVCECFLTGVKSHNNQTCLNKRKYICKLCGLRIPSDNMASHGKLHSIHGNLKLRNFKFLDIKGNHIIPPMSRFPHCDTCLVHFTSKMATDNHVCGEIKYVVCNSCNEKFTKIAFRLHSRFHSYLTSGSLEKSCSNQKSDKTSLYNGLETFVIEKSVKEEIAKKKLVISIPKLKNPVIETHDNVSSEIYKKIVYSCNGCEIVFDGYDSAVEHCQLHYQDKSIVFSGKHCEICGLIYETKDYENHINTHSSNKDKYFKICFDLDYFIQENVVWVEHVFGSIPESVKNDIFKDSIYKFEARIKMKVIRDGIPDLTIYQCDNCNLCVETVGIFNHTKNCFTQKSHPCSICGLRFVSYVGRIAHENIHNANVSYESFRLVKFNIKCDKQINENITSLKKYVLYQCRNCSGIINIFKFSSHSCEPMELCSCLQCGLLIQLNDIRLHKKKHTDCLQYNSANMKIILCGQKKQNVTNMHTPSFTGFICDFTFYKCARCETCVKDFQRSKHICTKTKFKCNICDLYFLTYGHKKLHDQNPDFVKPTINLIEFNTNQDNISESTTKTGQEITLTPTTHTPIYDIYKCPFCTLHFLSKQGVFDHLKLCNTKVRDSKESTEKCTKCSDHVELCNTKVRDSKESTEKCTKCSDHVELCNTKVRDSKESTEKCTKCSDHVELCNTKVRDSKESTEKCTKCSDHVELCNTKVRNSKESTEKCTKCNLLFNSSSLFNHLVKHHGSGSKNYEFKLIDVNRQNLAFKCSKCTLHFSTYAEAFEHTTECGNVKSEDCNKCAICHLDFSRFCIQDHANSRCNKCRSSQIVTVQTVNAKAMEFIESKNDGVLKRHLDLAESSLSSMNISLYSNVLYKCNICNVYFAAKTSFFVHIMNKSHNSIVLGKCNICTLDFELSALTPHIFFHHKKWGLLEKDFIVIHSKDLW